MRPTSIRRALEMVRTSSLCGDEIAGGAQSVGREGHGGYHEPVPEGQLLVVLCVDGTHQHRPEPAVVNEGGERTEWVNAPLTDFHQLDRRTLDQRVLLDAPVQFLM
jgi:hypothetical protein